LTYNSIASLNYDKYHSLAKKILSDHFELVVCDSMGKAVWQSPDLPDAELESILAKFKTALVENDKRRSQSEPIERGASKEIYYRFMRDRGGRNYGAVIVAVENTIGVGSEWLPADSLGHSVNDLIEILVDFIDEEYQLCDELNSMASELSQRYDEINLVYHTSDQVSNFSEGRDLLQGLIKSCVDYLNVDMAALLLPGKSVTIDHWGDNWSTAESHAVLEMIGDCFYPRVVETGDSFVVNDLNDSLWKKTGADFYCKLVCCPVMLEHTVAGVMVIAGQYDRNDFTNADKHLLEVMARKVGKVVQASFDALTGLLNRRSFESLLESKLSSIKGGRKAMALLFINVDQLKVINDTAGIQVGDEVIASVGKLLSSEIRDSDVAASLGGDSYGVLLEGCAPGNCIRVANKLRRLVTQLPFTWKGQQYPLNISIGVLPLADVELTAQDAIASAELTCDIAKQSGHSGVHTFSSKRVDIIRRKEDMSWVHSIHQALKENHFKLYAQAIYGADHNADIHHFEVLLRLQGENGKIIAPGAFMPAAEQYRLMPAIDRWVVSETLAILERYREQLDASPITWAVNLSGQSLGDPGFKEFVLSKTNECHFPSSRIGFEVTETSAIQNLEAAQSFIYTLKSEGCLFYLDDFGTGLSSFDYLKILPLDYIKIDGKFIKDILEDPVSVAMVDAINKVGQVMGIKTIAEFVETEDIWKYLIDIGVDFGQGYGLSKPKPIEAAIAEVLDSVRQKV